jgi:uncharacterized SAM-binding protein YcdF (DUF218 family)
MGRSTAQEQPPKPRRFRRIATLVIALALVAAVLLPIVTAVVVITTSRDDSRRVADTIIVLGAAQDNGEPRDVFAARLDHAAALYEDGVADHIITVGGKAPGDRFTEAEAGKAYLVDAGVPSGDITAVGEGRNTFDSLVGAAELMSDEGWCTATLVSDPWHMLRSRTMARDLGMDAVTSPTRSGPTVRLSQSGRYIVRETAAQLTYLLTALQVEPVVDGCN